MEIYINYLEHTTAFFRYAHGADPARKYDDKMYAHMHYPVFRTDKPWTLFLFPPKIYLLFK